MKPRSVFFAVGFEAQHIPRLTFTFQEKENVNHIKCLEMADDDAGRRAPSRKFIAEVSSAHVVAAEHSSRY